MASTKSKENESGSHHESEQQISKGPASTTPRSFQLEDFDATLGKAKREGEEDDTISETESHHSDHHNSHSTRNEEEKCEEGIDHGLIEKASTEAAIYEAVVQEGAEDQDSLEQKAQFEPSSQDIAAGEDGQLAYSTELVHDLYRLVLETHPDEDGDVDPSKWEPVRNYLVSSPDLTQRAARIRNSGGLTPFHQVCRHQPPMEIIELFISCVGSFVLKLIDDRGKLPVHHACATNASAEVIIALVQLYPESKIQQDTSGATPLHFAITNADLDIFVLFHICTEGSASIADRHGMLPLHYAVLFKKFSKPKVVQLLIETYPLGLTSEDLKGRAPLRWFAKSCHIDDSLELLEYSFSLTPWMGKGDMGLLLLSHLGECAEKNGKSDNIQKFLALLLKHNPEPADAFMAVLNRLPRWLNKTGEKPKRRFLFRKKN